MDYLNRPVVWIALVVLGIALLIRWLISIVPRRMSPHEKPQPAHRLEIDGLINKLSRKERTEIKQYMAENRKILAIKYFRAVTQAGLREAKEAVERMADEG